MTPRRHAPSLLAPGLAALAAFFAGNTLAQSGLPPPTLYGLLDVAAGRFQEPGQHHVAGLESGAMQLSYLGIRGSDDLGGGLRARFGLESYVHVDTATA